MRSTSVLSRVRRLPTQAPHVRVSASQMANRYPSASLKLPTTWPPKIAKSEDTHNFIDNQLKSSAATSWIDVHDPATNNVVTRVLESTNEELKAAVESAQRAFPEWQGISVLKHQ
ncbi:hypothetical protein F4803DRAFT_286089 [Xylaria telfairii]|nr:hypothetical protein F4803DRAFT_286089 [Xylaria telfairii]